MVSNSVSDVQIRLIGAGTGEDFEGVVHLRINGQWGTVCSDGWTEANSRTICKHMGLR